MMSPTFSALRNSSAVTAGTHVHLSSPRNSKTAICKSHSSCQTFLSPGLTNQPSDTPHRDVTCCHTPPSTVPSSFSSSYPPPLCSNLSCHPRSLSSSLSPSSSRSLQSNRLRLSPKSQKKTNFVSCTDQFHASWRDSSNGTVSCQHPSLPEDLGMWASDCHVAGVRGENGGASAAPATWKDREAWHPVDPMWEGDVEQILETGIFSYPLPPAWRLMILSDGSVTRHLSLLTGCHVAVDCVEMQHIGQSLEGLPAEVALVPGPRVQRQVYLRTEEGECLAYAASWWAAGEVNGYLKEVKEPMWVNFSRQRTELFRSVQRLYVGHSSPLEESFEMLGPFWARHYLFYHHGRPLTLIYEVFSPKLEKYLGPMR